LGPVPRRSLLVWLAVVLLGFLTFGAVAYGMLLVNFVIRACWP